MWGAYPPPPAPPASGKVPVPGRGRCSAKTRSVGGGKKIRNNVKLSSRFFAERCPLPRRCKAGGSVLTTLRALCLLLLSYSL